MFLEELSTVYSMPLQRKHECVAAYNISTGDKSALKIPNISHPFPH
jgi:hypothetical protein